MNIFFTKRRRRWVNQERIIPQLVGNIEAVNIIHFEEALVLQHCNLCVMTGNVRERKFAPFNTVKILKKEVCIISNTLEINRITSYHRNPLRNEEIYIPFYVYNRLLFFKVRQSVFKFLLSENSNLPILSDSEQF